MTSTDGDLPRVLLYAYEDLLSDLVVRSACTAPNTTDPCLIIFDEDEKTHVDIFEFAAATICTFGNRWLNGMVSMQRFADRDYAQSQTRRKNRAALLLQASFRGMQGRQYGKNIRKKAEAMKARQRAELEAHHACVIQCSFRLKHARTELNRRRRHRQHLCEDSAARKVQSGARGRSGRRKAKRLREEKRIAAAAAAAEDEKRKVAEDKAAAKIARANDMLFVQTPVHLTDEAKENLDELAQDVAKSRQETVNNCIQSLQLGVRLGADGENARQKLTKLFLTLKDACQVQGCAIPQISGLDRLLNDCKSTGDNDYRAA